MKSMQNYTRVAVHGVPRSGTSWLGEILNSSPHVAYSYQPLFSYVHKDYLSDTSSREEIHRFFARLRHCRDDFTNQKVRREIGDFPKFRKDHITHVAYKEVRYMNILSNLMRKADDVKLCAIVRNPLAVINSWLKAPREFRKDLGWNELDEWQYALKKNLNRPEEYHGFEKWKEAADIFLELQKLYPDRVHLVLYSNLLSEPLLETTKLFEFLGLDLVDQTIRFLDNSMSCERNDAYAVYKRKQSDDEWKTLLHSEIVEQIVEDLKGTRLEKFIRG